ncbi:hypothetical protein HDU97_009471 [Phlyctochytrium planicorne]|nr:hypothetical protein HDU97_009471 [Phlyctochytrium planicorne]
MNETVSQLEQLFQLSRISQEDFLQIWNLISLGNPTVNQEQFIYFKHILDSRRKGRSLPVGVPLHIKEAFLKERVETRVYTRTVLGTRDPGASSGKELGTLQIEFDAVEEKLRASSKKQQELDEKLKDLVQVRDELQGLVQFKRMHLSALKDDVQTLKDKESSVIGGSSGSAGTEIEHLFQALNQEKQSLVEQKRHLSSIV